MGSDYFCYSYDFYYFQCFWRYERNPYVVIVEWADIYLPAGFYAYIRTNRIYAEFISRIIWRIHSGFFRLSLLTGASDGDTWAKSWPIFYWCVWMAWAPISGVFLGKILRGYTIRDAIKCNFIIPSIFSMIWMGLFSTASIYYEMNGAGLYDSLLNNGTESVVYKVFEQLPLSVIIIPFYLVIVFISFVTAADSNTNAMSGLCVSGITVENQESPAWLKVCWGVSLGLLTWVVISFAGIDGIKAASNLGGFPMLFIIIIMMAGLWKISLNPQKYDIYKEDYDSNGRPIESERLPVEE